MNGELTMAHEHYQACIDACNACATACNHCAAACLQEDGIAELRECIRLDLDCAQACALATAYMARGSEYAPDTCTLCADICDACADECDRLSASEQTPFSGRSPHRNNQAIAENTSSHTK